MRNFENLLLAQRKMDAALLDAEAHVPWGIALGGLWGAGLGAWRGDPRRVLLIATGAAGVGCSTLFFVLTRGALRVARHGNAAAPLTSGFAQPIDTALPAGLLGVAANAVTATSTSRLFPAFCTCSLAGGAAHVAFAWLDTTWRALFLAHHGVFTPESNIAQAYVSARDWVRKDLDDAWMRQEKKFVANEYKSEQGRDRSRD